MLRGARDLRLEPLRHLDAVVDLAHRNRQDCLDRSAAIARAAVDALKAVIAADHQETAAALHPFRDELQPVRRALAAEKRIGMQKQRVGADVAQHHDVVGR